MTPKEEAPGKSRVIVIEDHPVLCDGLRQLIHKQPDFACVGVADNTSDAKRLVERCKPDLMVLDLRLKGGDALDLIKTFRVEHPELKVLVLSQYDELIFAERALRAGASGYIMKSERLAVAVMQRTPFGLGRQNGSQHREEHCADSQECRVQRCDAPDLVLATPCAL